MQNNFNQIGDALPKLDPSEDTFTNGIADTRFG